MWPCSIHTVAISNHSPSIELSNSQTQRADRTDKRIAIFAKNPPRLCPRAALIFLDLIATAFSSIIEYPLDRAVIRWVLQFCWVRDWHALIM